jgi:hypothetical protein
VIVNRRFPTTHIEERQRVSAETFAASTRVLRSLRTWIEASLQQARHWTVRQCTVHNISRAKGKLWKLS